MREELWSFVETVNERKRGKKFVWNCGALLGLGILVGLFFFFWYLIFNFDKRFILKNLTTPGNYFAAFFFFGHEKLHHNFIKKKINSIHLKLNLAQSVLNFPLFKLQSYHY